MLEMGIGALLHDVGKMKISPQIIKKPDNLNEKRVGGNKKTPDLQPGDHGAIPGDTEQSKQLALQHHERYNGSGYPFGLKGDAIGLFGQIAGIIDFYSAVTRTGITRRPFNPMRGSK